MARKPPLITQQSILDLAAAADPPVELAPYVGAFHNAGVEELYVATLVYPGGAMIPAGPNDLTDGRRQLVVMAKARRFVATDNIGSANELGESLDRLRPMVQSFDRLARFTFAATDMELVASAAAALIEDDDRIAETGMVVTYARPFGTSDDASLPSRWRPTDPCDRKLHNELIDLRNEYHAHAAHTPRRKLEDTTALLGMRGRPIYSESWEHLPTYKLAQLTDLATRQAARFRAEAHRIDRELFGPHD